ncbi:MAG: hypothetical protein GXO69_01940 [Acidobacteria bacterium]|nr:hypothetical protein [Acidobacteriota bacterium]
MEISCPNCSKKYRVDDSLIPEKGRKVKCRKCGHVFLVRREQPEPEPETGFQLDLDFESPSSPAGGGTIKISQEQIDASIRKAAAKTEKSEDSTEEAESPGIELDLEYKSDEKNFTRDDAVDKADPDAVRYVVRVEGNEFTGLTLDELKKWISEDRLLEVDEVSREGSKVWVPAERVPELMKTFKMHIYEQRKRFDEEDNPYLRFKEREEQRGTKETGNGFLNKLLSLFKKG